MPKIRGNFIHIDATNFNKNLSTACTDVQSALEVIDDLELGASDSINIETLTANKTLLVSDVTNHIYNTNGANLNLYLPTVSLHLGKKFIIKNNNDASSSNAYLAVYSDTTLLEKIYAQAERTYVYDGTNWILSAKNSIVLGQSSSASGSSIAIGNSTTATTGSVSIGSGASSSTNGVAVGGGSSGSASGVAIGVFAVGNTSGVAVGLYANTNSQAKQTVALGAYSKNERNREIASASDDITTHKSLLSIQKWKYKDISCDGNWYEIFVDAFSSRLTLLTNSAYQFYIQILMKDYNSQLVKAFELRGLVNIDANAIPSLVGSPQITIIGASAGTDLWEVRLTADLNTKTYLKLEIKADTSGHNLRVTANSFNTEQRY